MLRHGKRDSLAGVVRVNSLDIEVPRLLEQLHQDRLHTLALVQHGLRAHFQSTYVLEINVILLDEAREGGKG